MTKNPNLDVSPETERAWPKTGLAPLNAFYDEMTQGLPTGTQLNPQARSDGRLLRLEYSFGDAADPLRKDFSFKFKRAFAPDGRSVDNADAKVGKHLQKLGIARTVNVPLFRMYDKLGITGITLIASDAGLYAQSKIAAQPDPEWIPEIADNVRARVDWIEANPDPSKERLPRHYLNALRRWDESGNGKDLWFICDQAHEYYGKPMGKTLTLNRDYLAESFVKALGQGRALDPVRDVHRIWMGGVELGDGESATRYNAYLHGRGHGKDRSIETARRLGLDRDDIVRFMGVEPPRRPGVGAVPALVAP